MIPSPFLIQRYDVVYGIYLQDCIPYVLAARLLGKRTVVHVVGGDAYRFIKAAFWKKILWRFVLDVSSKVLYVSLHLESLTGRSGFVLPFPIAVDAFRRVRVRNFGRDRDVLYYCPGRQGRSVYRLDWILAYAKKHRDQKITIVGSRTQPADYKVDLPNVQVVPFVDYSEMPALYRKHRMLIRMTTRDGLPRMIHEALIAGLKVIFNGHQVTHVPKERDPSYFAKAFSRIICTNSKP